VSEVRFLAKIKTITNQLHEYRTTEVCVEASARVENITLTREVCREIYLAQEQPLTLFVDDLLESARESVESAVKTYTGNMQALQELLKARGAQVILAVEEDFEPFEDEDDGEGE
jgi:hypothetical protein